MDPTDTELVAIVDLNGALAWAGVELELEAAVRAALGQPARVREIALVPRSTWDAVVNALQVPTGDPAPTPGDPRPTRALTPVEGARIESFRRVCFLRVGRVPTGRFGSSSSCTLSTSSSLRRGGWRTRVP